MTSPRTKLPRWIKADEDGLADYPVETCLVSIAHYGNKLHISTTVFADETFCGKRGVIGSVSYVGESDRYEVCRACRVSWEEKNG